MITEAFLSESTFKRKIIPSLVTQGPSNYAFGYSVQDDYSGDDFSHSEVRDGDKTTGEYRVSLPDGRTQIVSYVADENGYVADVKYEGEVVPYAPRPHLAPVLPVAPAPVPVAHALPAAPVAPLPAAPLAALLPAPAPFAHSLPPAPAPLAHTLPAAPFAGAAFAHSLLAPSAVTPALPILEEAPAPVFAVEPAAPVAAVAVPDVPLARELPSLVPEAGLAPIPGPAGLGPHAPIPARPLVPGHLFRAGPVPVEAVPEKLPVQPLLPEPVTIVHDLRRLHSPIPRVGLIPTPTPFGPTPLAPLVPGPAPHSPSLPLLRP